MTRSSTTRRLSLSALFAAAVLVFVTVPVAGADTARLRGPQLDFQGNRLRQDNHSSATAVIKTQSAEQSLPKIAPTETAVGAPHKPQPVAAAAQATGERSLRTQIPVGRTSETTSLSVTGPLRFSRQRTATLSATQAVAPTRLVVPGSQSSAPRIVTDTAATDTATTDTAATARAVQAQPAEHISANGQRNFAERAFETRSIDEQPHGPLLGQPFTDNDANTRATEGAGSSSPLVASSAVEDDYGYPKPRFDDAADNESDNNESDNNDPRGSHPAGAEVRGDLYGYMGRRDIDAEPPAAEYSAAEDFYTASRLTDLPRSSTVQPLATDPAVSVSTRVATAAAKPRHYIASGVTHAGRGNYNPNYQAASYDAANRQQTLYDGAIYSPGAVAMASSSRMPASPMFGGQLAFSPRQMFGSAMGEPEETAVSAWPNMANVSTQMAPIASGAVNYELAGPAYGPMGNNLPGSCAACGDGSLASCSGCGQCNDCCVCPPNCYWQAGVQAQVLRRSSASSRGPLVECDCLFQHELTFNASDADLQWGAGYRFDLRRVNHCGPDFEIIYSNNEDWVYDNWFTGNLIVLGTNIGTGSAHARYRSSLQSAEANLALPWDNWTNVLVGFRWLELDEQASITARGNNAAFATSVETVNDLYGGQLGIERAVLDQGDPFTIYATAKTGVYANRIVRTSTGFSTATATSNEVSFTADLEILARYQFNPHLAFTAGYNLLWLETTALALEQYPDPTGAIDTSGSPFYHGFQMGLELVW